MSDPMDALKQWHEWYDGHRVVAEIDEPLVTKDSRECLHDTTNARETLLSEIKQKSIEKATEYFADTISEFCNKLSGKDMYKAFYAAAVENYQYAEKEYKKAKDLLSMLRFNNEKN